MEDEVKKVIPNAYACLYIGFYNDPPPPPPHRPHVSKEGNLNTDMPTKKETPWYQDKPSISVYRPVISERIPNMSIKEKQHLFISETEKH